MTQEVLVCEVCGEEIAVAGSMVVCPGCRSVYSESSPEPRITDWNHLVEAEPEERFDFQHPLCWGRVQEPGWLTLCRLRLKDRDTGETIDERGWISLLAGEMEFRFPGLIDSIPYYLTMPESDWHLRLEYLSYIPFGPETLYDSRDFTVKAEIPIPVYEGLTARAFCENPPQNVDEMRRRITGEVEGLGYGVIVDAVTVRDNIVTIAIRVPVESPLIPAWIIALITTHIVGIILAVGLVSILAWYVWTKTHVYCPYCGAAFVTMAQLAMHIKADHPGEAPYICPICGAISDTAEELDEHMKKAHPSLIEKYIPHIITAVTAVSIFAVGLSAITRKG